ncbi:MAG: hypothetical protein H0U76_20295 [Ktedonobacteraceae bacterium]|nr:hypothetical protein [Ktedonobacteraceae bacterium]
MIQGHYAAPGQGKQTYILRPHGSRLLRQHPILLPVVLIGSATGLCMSSFFADTLFPVLAFLGVAPALVCLSVALVLGIVGILTGIISLIERFEPGSSTYDCVSGTEGAELC